MVFKKHITLIKYKHKKSNAEYYVIDWNIINATNSVSFDKENMILYVNCDGKMYVREEHEFNEKFEKMQ